MTSILTAALDALAEDPDVSMAEVARRAGVVRATIYVHFPTREALIEAVTQRVIAEVTQAMAAAEPDRDDPAEALARVLATAWGQLDRYHALVSINAHGAPEDVHRLHGPVLSFLQPLIERGQRAGTFRADVPAAWHLATLLAIVHTASEELQAGRLPRNAVESALLTTALGALGARSGGRP